MEINKAVQKLSILDQYNNNKTWDQINIVNEDILNHFWKSFVQRRRTQARTTGKCVTAIRNWITFVENQSIVLHKLPEVQCSMETQAQSRQDSVIRHSHEIDPHLDIPMRVLSIDEENVMLKTAIEYCKNNVLTFEESMLFLTTYKNTKQRMMRGETFLKRKFCDRVVNNKEGPHRKWSLTTLKVKTNHSHVENTDYLLISPMGQKKKSERKSMSGCYRHYCVHRCPVFWIAVTTLLHTMKASDDSTIPRELSRCGDSDLGYLPERAHANYKSRLSRNQALFLNPKLRDHIIEKLTQCR